MEINLEKCIKIAVQSLEKLKDGIENNELTDSEALEFLECYRKDICNLLNTKIETIKTLSKEKFCEHCGNLLIKEAGDHLEAGICARCEYNDFIK